MPGSQAERRHRRELRLRQVARETLGYERLRPGQAEAVDAVLQGRDTLAVLPTGLGKSVIYQLAGIQLEGPTVVVSPLIALQRDQLDAIVDADLPSAATLNSTMRKSERDDALNRLASGDLEFIFLAPEQFANDEVLESLQAAEPSLFVVDEAHCISDWGHDFRPEYLRLGAVVEELGSPVVLALTATAAPPIRAEIVDRLHMEDPALVVRGFDRPNIHLAVESFADEDTKRAAFVERVREATRPGIVYVSTRTRTEELANALNEAGIPAAAYHAGLAKRQRNHVQSTFMNGRTRVIVATTAFGMGIDKHDVRFVFHYDIADSVDAYYQEVGRAGRDGEPAAAVLFYRSEDLALRRFFSGTPDLRAAEIDAVLRVLERARRPLRAEEIASRTEVSNGHLRAVLDHLTDAAAIETAPDGAVRLVSRGNRQQLVEAAEEANDRRATFERTRVEMIRGYAETRDCRREYLLSYFGEAFQGPCGNCDNCDSGSPQAHDRGEQPFPLQSRVVHPDFGEGSIVRYEPGRVTVLFDDGGYRTLRLDLVLDDGLLRPALTIVD